MDIHAFVVKLWLEPREIKEAQPELRGRIDHVQSGKYIYFRELTAIIHFIKRFLGANGGSEPKDKENEPETSNEALPSSSTQSPTNIPGLHSPGIPGDETNSQADQGDDQSGG